MKNEKICIEYLLIVDTKNNFCVDKATFNNLLKVNSEIDFKNNKLNYKGVSFDYTVQTKELENEKMSFHVYFASKEFNNLDLFEEFLRALRGIFGKINANLHTLRDDLSFYYSQNSYPIIHELENLMRKLITKFMITNIGLSWTDNHVPKEIQSDNRRPKKNENENYLYNLDFIQLSDFLFKEYSPVGTEDLIAKIKKANTIEDISLIDLKEFVPTSNWEKFFSQIVECDASYLKKRWEKLYMLRNKIAHNNILNRAEFEQIQNYSNDLKQYLDKAIASLDQINIPEEEKEMVSNSMRWSKNNIKIKFLTACDHMNWYFDDVMDTDEIIKFNSIFEKISYLLDRDYLPEELLTDAREVSIFRNKLTQFPETIDSATIEEYIVLVEQINDYLERRHNFYSNDIELD